MTALAGIVAKNQNEEHDMNWELIKVKQTNWIQDDSGYYTLINWIDDNTVRLDVMNTDGSPEITFQGSAGDVRKYAMRWMDTDQNQNNDNQRCYSKFSAEHAGYIGSELARCELLKSEYIQD